MNILCQIIAPLFMAAIFVGVYIYERYRTTIVSETKELSTMDSRNIANSGKIDISKFPRIWSDFLYYII